MPKIQHLAFRIEYHHQVSSLQSVITIISKADPSKNGEFPGIWDTGAMSTVVTPQVAECLSLPPIGTTHICGVNSDEIVPVVLIDLVLPSQVKIESIRAAVAKIKGADVLIGMNIITLGDFSVSNLNGETELSFAVPPFENRTDLLEKADHVNKRNKW
jgi:predicted aspartyl protease